MSLAVFSIHSNNVGMEWSATYGSQKPAFVPRPVEINACPETGSYDRMIKKDVLTAAC